MPSYISLNSSAFHNLMDGRLAPYARVSLSGDGDQITIKLLARQVAGAAPTHENLIPLPDDLSDRFADALLGVRIDDHDNLVVYRTSRSLKALHPSARVVSAPAAPEPVRAQRETVKKPTRITPPSSPHLRGFLIKAEEIQRETPIASPQKSAQNLTCDETLEEMEARLLRRWDSSADRHNRIAPTLHFKEPETIPEDSIQANSKLRLEKTIKVPVSFDRRRGLGTRNVEVVIKRRRTHVA